VCTVTSELKPLIYDKDQPRYLRELIMDARLQEGPRYDIKAGLAKHRAIIASGAPAPDWMNEPVGSALKGGLFTQVIGIAAIPMVITGALWGVWMLSSPPTNAKKTFDPSVNQSAQAAPIAAKPAQANPSPRANLTEKTETVVEATRQPSPERSDDSSPTEKPAVSLKAKRPGAIRASNNPSQPMEVADQPRPGLLSDRRDELADKRGEQTTPSHSSIETTVTKPATAASVQSAGQATAPLTARPVTTAPAATLPATAQQVAVDSVLQREMALLAQARRFVESRPLSALALVQGKEPKTGLLNEEWDQVYLLSLVKLGRIEEARVAAQRFRSHYPNSAFNERIRKELPPSVQ
jgi:hypothetical protein